MGYFLLDHPNPRAGNKRFHGHPARNGGVRPRVIVVHTAETAPTAGSANAIARYFSTTDRAASYHTVVDSDEALRLLPDTAVAFHCVGANTYSLGLSLACRAADWGDHPAWEAAAFGHTAAELARMTAAWGIPLGLISADQARAGRSGVVTHAWMDPGRRSDPGRTFPLLDLLAAARDLHIGAAAIKPAPKPAPHPNQEDDVILIINGPQGIWACSTGNMTRRHLKSPADVALLQKAEGKGVTTLPGTATWDLLNVFTELPVETSSPDALESGYQPRTRGYRLLEQVNTRLGQIVDLATEPVSALDSK